MSRADLDLRASELRADGVPFVRARVVLAERPTSSKPGDEAIVRADGSMEGFVGGTCAETTVRAQSMLLLDAGASGTSGPLLLRITPTEEGPTAVAPTVPPARTTDRQTLPAAAGTMTVHNPCLSGGTLEIFLDPVLPAPLVQVHGEGPIADAVRRVAAAMDYRVGPAHVDGVIGAQAVVVASHGRTEIETLAAALDAGVPYIALVASPRRGAGVLADLAAARPDLVELIDRVRTPAGLDIGARTPGEVAVSILAGMIATRATAPPNDLLIPAPVAAQHPELATDPVCGMSVPAVPSSLQLTVDRRVAYFCGPGCQQAFDANPAGYPES